MKIFGLEHILFLSFTILFTIISIIIFNKFIPKNKFHIVIKITSIILLIFIISSRILLSIKNNNPLSFLPSTYCSMMGFVLPIVALFFKPNSKTFQFAISAGFIGGILTIIYPDFIELYNSMFEPIPFTGFVYHALMVYLFCISLFCKYYLPTFKNWSSLPIGLAFMVVVGEFGNTVLGQSNNMNLNRPILEGTIFTWWFLGISIIIWYTIILQIIEFFVLPKQQWAIIKFFNKIKQVFVRKHTTISNTSNNYFYNKSKIYYEKYLQNKRVKKVCAIIKRKNKYLVMIENGKAHNIGGSVEDNEKNTNSYKKRSL